VEDNHTEYDRRIDPQVEHQLDEAGTEKDIDEDIVELRQEPHERPPLLALRQAVGAVLLQADRGFACIQAFLDISGEPPRHLVHRHGMPGDAVGCGISVRSAHRLIPPGRFLDDSHGTSRHQGSLATVLLPHNSTFYYPS